MGSEVGNVGVLRNLAEDLLTPDENSTFRDVLREYRKSNSLTTLVAQLTQIVTTTEKLMLLVELSGILPAHLRRDFHKLCCLHFPKYESFLTYFTPTSVGERSRIITQDPTGKFQVVSSRFDKNLHLPLQNAKLDQRSLPGESGIDVSSDIDDISRHGEGGQSDPSGTWKIKSARSNSLSSYAGPAARTTSPTPSSEQQSWRQSQTSLQTGESNGIRNRARSLRILSGSLPTVFASKEDQEPNSNRSETSKVRILLKRREDGSLGIGIKGGKEYNSPIDVYLVEPGSQAEMKGLRVGDRILDVNGTDFGNVSHAEAVTLIRNAWNVIMIVQRQNNNRKTNNRNNTGGRDAHEELEITLYPKKGKLGCGVYRDDRGNLAVSNVEKSSAASEAGLCKGDRFIQIDGMKVCSLTDKQIATLTNAKRVRLKIYRPPSPNKSRPEVDSAHLEFDNLMSSVALDLSPLELGDDADIVSPFSSSTPRLTGRSHSEERRRNPSHRHEGRGRSSSEIRPQTTNDQSHVEHHRPNGEMVEHQVEVEVHYSEDTPRIDTPPLPPSSPPPQLKHHRQTEHAFASTSSRSRSSYQSNSDNFSKINSAPVHHYYHQQQQRMYRPPVVTSSTKVVSPQPHHLSSNHNKSLGKYMTNHYQPALPSRLAVVYSSKARHDHEKDRSRPKKRSGVTVSLTTSKMKQLRNRSYSPHVSSTSSGSSHPRRDREFLRAIQNSVERRQRAHRLSVYQLPNQDDDAWNIL